MNNQPSFYLYRKMTESLLVWVKTIRRARETKAYCLRKFWDSLVTLPWTSQYWMSTCLGPSHLKRNWLFCTNAWRGIESRKLLYCVYAFQVMAKSGHTFSPMLSNVSRMQSWSFFLRDFQHPPMRSKNLRLHTIVRCGLLKIEYISKQRNPRRRKRLKNESITNWAVYVTLSRLKYHSLHTCNRRNSTLAVVISTIVI